MTAAPRPGKAALAGGLAVCLCAWAANPSSAVAEDGVQASGAVAVHQVRAASAYSATDLTGATVFFDVRARHGDFGARLDSVVQWPGSGSTVRRDPALREAWVEYKGGSLDLRVGRQLIIWGRADRFNPTDVITPADLGLLTTEDQGQRFGATGAVATWAVTDNTSLIGVALPSFRSTQLYDRFFPADTAAPAHRKPDVGVRHPQLGLKLDRTGTGFDASISWYRGYLPTPALALALDANPSAVLVHPRSNTVGADFAVARGALGLRGEVAYTKLSSDASQPKLGPVSSLYAVLGVERSFGNANSLLVQWLYRRLDDPVVLSALPAPLQPLARANAALHGQFDSSEQGLSLTLISRWYNDTLTTELSAAMLRNHGDFALRPKVSWAIDDQWKLNSSLELFRGPQDSPFGALRRTSRLMVELRRSF